MLVASGASPFGKQGEKGRDDMERSPSGSQGFSGTINLELTDLIQMVCLSRSDIVIHVTSRRDAGMIHVRRGEIRHAETEQLKGESAFYEMLRWKDGKFELISARELDSETVEKAWEYLLLEAMRQRDEASISEVQSSEAAEQERTDVEDESSTTEVCEPVALEKRIEEAFKRYEATGAARIDKPVNGLQDAVPASERGVTEPIKVLVVDDSPFFARQIRSALEADPGIRVVACARNGKEAVDYLSSNPQVDLITLDVQMPVMPGDSTLKHIMVRFGAPVLMISSFQAQSLNNICEFLQLGAVDFLTKPSAGEDVEAYGDILRDTVRRVSHSKVSHFRRRRKPAVQRPLDRTLEEPSKDVLVILGAEGAYVEWFRLPLRQMVRRGLVIGLQKISDELLAGFCRVIQEKTRSSTTPIMHSEWVNPGSLYFGNAGQKVRLQLVLDEPALGIEMGPACRLSWFEGIQLWVSQIADQARSRMSLYFLSAAHALPPPFTQALLECNVRMIVPPLETLLCTDLVESVLPFTQSHGEQLAMATPENLMEVWLENGRN